MAFAPNIVTRDPADSGNGAANTAKIVAAILAAVAGGFTGITLQAGAWPVQGSALGVVRVPVNFEVVGETLMATAAGVPTVQMALVSTDGTGGNVVTSAVNGYATGNTVRRLAVDGGRAIGGWGTQQGACFNFAGHNDYPAGGGRHNLQVIDCTANNGFTQQWSLNSLKGYSITYTAGNGTMTSSLRPTVTAHGCDNDAVAYEKPCCFGTITGVAFSGWGQEDLKHENSTDITYRDCSFALYVSLVQDQTDVYTEMGRIQFINCTFNGAVNLSNAKRRRIPGAFGSATGADTCTLSAPTGTAATTTGHTFTAADVGKQLAQVGANGAGVIVSVSGGNATVNITTTFSTTSLTAGNWLLLGTHLKPAKALTLTGSTTTVGASITIGGYPFLSTGGGVGTGDHVGMMVGFYSGLGTGAAQITTVAANVATATVVTPFSTTTPGSASWVLASTDNAGDGSITFTSCTFGPGGLIWGQDASSNGYGTITVEYCTFSADGNSIVVPAGVTVTKRGNLNDTLPVKRFARPSVDPRYNGTTIAGADAGQNSIGGTGVAGLSEFCARGNAPTTIGDSGNSASTPIGVVKAGEEVRLLNGVYAATPGGNRSMGLRGLGFLLRPDSMCGAVLDLSSGSGYVGLSITGVVESARVWGLVFYGPGLGGGNGIAVSVAPPNGSSATCKPVIADCAYIRCKTANNGSAIKVSGGSPMFDGYTVLGNDLTTSQGAVYLSISATNGSPTLRRGVIRNSVSTGATVAGLRWDVADGGPLQGLELYGNTCATGAGGAYFSKPATVYNLTAYGNVGGGIACDVGVANGVTVTGDSWICWSADNGSIKPVNNSTSGALALTNSTVQGGASAARFGNNTSQSWPTVSSNDPQFVDAVGGNLQLKATSPVLTAGTQRTGTWDAWARPFAAATQGAWAA